MDWYPIVLCSVAPNTETCESSLEHMPVQLVSIPQMNKTHLCILALIIKWPGLYWTGTLFLEDTWAGVGSIESIPRVVAKGHI